MSLEDYEKAKMKPPFHLSDKKYSKGQILLYCKYCKDTAFMLLIDKQKSKLCCRCGKEV